MLWRVQQPFGIAKKASALMAKASLQKSVARSTSRPTLPSLENGDRLDQKSFHERYQAMPEHVRAELIGGIVHMPSPLKFPHGKNHSGILRWLFAYEDATPGTLVLENTTVILGPESEPQPDTCLLIFPGGQTFENEDAFLEGPPELIVETASSSESIDLHRKKDDYKKAKVGEYIVLAVRKKQVHWFVLHRGKFKELKPGPDGILRSEVFPGLWLDPAALIRGDRQRVLEVLRQGLASPEHMAFVSKLAAKKK
jgi:Uma2 family endonuclease